MSQITNFKSSLFIAILVFFAGAFEFFSASFFSSVVIFNLIFFFIFFAIVFLHGARSPYIFFMAASFIFIFDRYFFWALGYVNVIDCPFQGDDYRQIEFKYLRINFYFFIASAMPFLLFDSKKKYVVDKADQFRELLSRKLMFFFLVPFLLSVCYFCFLIFNQGFMSFYQNKITFTLSGLNIFNLSYKLLMFSLALYISSLPTKKDIKVFVLVGLPLFLMFLVGFKKIFVLYFVYVAWILLNEKEFKFNKKFFGLLSVTALTLILVPLVNYFRLFGSLKGYDFNFVSNLIIANSQTFCVGIYYLKYESYINGIIYPFFSPLTDLLTRISDVLGLNFFSQQNNLSVYLTRLLNPSGYEKGAGFGTSFFIEIYDLGGMAIGFVLTFLMFSIYRLFFMNVFRKSYLLLISYPVFTSFIFLPRGYYFKVFEQIILIMLIYFLYVFVEGKIKNASF